MIFLIISIIMTGVLCGISVAVFKSFEKMDNDMKSDFKITFTEEDE